MARPKGSADLKPRKRMEGRGKPGGTPDRQNYCYEDGEDNNMDNRLTREGARFVTSPRANHVNMNFVVFRLENCCNLHGGSCDGCPDLQPCVEAYDKRCALGETICRSCGDSVPTTKFCCNCGNLLGRKRRIT
jgi:hypothetical protein